MNQGVETEGVSVDWMIETPGWGLRGPGSVTCVDQHGAAFLLTSDAARREESVEKEDEVSQMMLKRSTTS